MKFKKFIEDHKVTIIVTTVAVVTSVVIADRVANSTAYRIMKSIDGRELMMNISDEGLRELGNQIISAMK